MKQERENHPLWDFRLVRELRKREKMSLEQLSERSGVSVSVISKLERNTGNAEMETLYRIARVFGMTLSDLIALAALVRERVFDRFHVLLEPEAEIVP